MPSAIAAEPDATRQRQLNDFIEVLVSQHGFDRQQVTNLLADVSLDPKVLDLLEPPLAQLPERPPSWEDYRSTHVSPLRIAEGRKFMQRYRAPLARAEEEYGVPASVITAILGIETNYGSYTGTFNTLRSLYTLAFAHPTRSQEFRNHLIGLFLLARQQGNDIRSYKGSYAGAVGLPQFMPSSWMRYAIDFDHDGDIDLISSYDDAIGSVAAYLKSFGWVANAPIALEIQSLDQARVDPWTSKQLGLRPRLSTQQLRRLAVNLGNGSLPPLPATIIELKSPNLPPEYWLAYNNFYVITRYNQSSFYAMAVFKLAQAISNETSFHGWHHSSTLRPPIEPSLPDR